MFYLDASAVTFYSLRGVSLRKPYKKTNRTTHRRLLLESTKIIRLQSFTYQTSSINSLYCAPSGIVEPEGRLKFREDTHWISLWKTRGSAPWPPRSRIPEARLQRPLRGRRNRQRRPSTVIEHMILIEQTDVSKKNFSPKNILNDVLLTLNFRLNCRQRMHNS